MGATQQINVKRLKKAKNELTNVYLKEETVYIQNQINKIWDSTEDRQSRKAQQTVKEVSRRNSTGRTKVEATSQEKRIHLWKQNLVNFPGKPPKVTAEPIRRIRQLDIKLGQFTQDELDSVLRKIIDT